MWDYVLNRESFLTQRLQNNTFFLGHKDTLRNQEALTWYASFILVRKTQFKKHKTTIGFDYILPDKIF